MSAGWFPENLRGASAGFGTRRGRRWVHLTALTVDGPAAIHRRALCGGIQATTLVDSSVNVDDPAECFEFLASQARLWSRFDLWHLRDHEMDRLCTECRTRFLKLYWGKVQREINENLPA